MTTESPSLPHRQASSIKVVGSKLLSEVTPEDKGTGPSRNFDIVASYNRQLAHEDAQPPPIAAVLALTELIANSRAETMYELVEALKHGASALKRATPNPIGLTAGCDLFIRYVTTARQEYANFTEHKNNLVKEGNLYSHNLANTCREEIAKKSVGFIPDEAVILTHSYSRVVMQALLYAHKRKRISVFITEARPRGLGVKAYEILTAAGVPCTLVLDSAVAYVMDRVSVVLVGSEAVVESGGLINAVGSYQMAIIAKGANKPFYALAESYKFLRSFPLSQYDLPIKNSNILPVPTQRPMTKTIGSNPRSTSSQVTSANTPPPVPAVPPTPGNVLRTSSSGYFAQTPPVLSMTPAQLSINPEVDYTRPDLISLVFSDVGILTPSGVSQYLVGIYAD